MIPTHLLMLPCVCAFESVIFFIGACKLPPEGLSLDHVDCLGCSTGVLFLESVHQHRLNTLVMFSVDLDELVAALQHAETDGTFPVNLKL